MPKHVVYKPSSNSKQIATEIAKEPKPNFTNTLRNYGEFKAGNNRVTGGTTIIYTCPEDYEFYVFSIVHQITTTDETLGDTQIKIKDLNVTRLRSAGMNKDQAVTSLVFPIPIRLIKGETIKIFSDADMQCVGSYSGYEIKAVDAKKFL